VACKNPIEYSPWWHKNKNKYAFILLYFICIIENIEVQKYWEVDPTETLLRRKKSKSISWALDNWGLSGQPLTLNLFHKFCCIFEFHRIWRIKKSWQASGCSIHCWNTVSTVININQCSDRGRTSPLHVCYSARLND
jgi:hypothetical protein